MQAYRLPSKVAGSTRNKVCCVLKGGSEQNTPVSSYSTSLRDKISCARRTRINTAVPTLKSDRFAGCCAWA